MTTTRKVLIQSQPAPVVQTTLYQPAAGVSAIVDKMTVTNTGSAARVVSINLIPSSGSVGTGNLITDEVSIAAGAVYECPEIVGHDLASGDRISVIASDNSLTIRASGREFTTG